MGAPSIIDGASILGQAVGVEEVAQVASGEYDRNVREHLPRDYVQAYHPDGTTSLVQLPPLGRNGKGMQDRQQKLIHYMVNKKKDGEQWWFFTPPEGWAPAPLPYRCPVTGCSRKGGLPDLLNLWRHIHQKHPGEVELYGGVLNAVKKKLAEEVPANLQDLLASGPTVSESEKQVATVANTTCHSCGEAITGALKDHQCKEGADVS